MHSAKFISRKSAKRFLLSREFNACKSYELQTCVVNSRRSLVWLSSIHEMHGPILRVHVCLYGESASRVRVSEELLEAQSQVVHRAENSRSETEYRLAQVRRKQTDTD